MPEGAIVVEGDDDASVSAIDPLLYRTLKEKRKEKGEYL